MNYRYNIDHLNHFIT